MVLRHIAGGCESALTAPPSRERIIAAVRCATSRRTSREDSRGEGGGKGRGGEMEGGGEGGRGGDREGGGGRGRGRRVSRVGRWCLSLKGCKFSRWGRREGIRRGAGLDRQHRMIWIWLFGPTLRTVLADTTSGPPSLDDHVPACTNHCGLDFRASIEQPRYTPRMLFGLCAPRPDPDDKFDPGQWSSKSALGEGGDCVVPQYTNSSSQADRANHHSFLKVEGGGGRQSRMGGRMVADHG